MNWKIHICMKTPAEDKWPAFDGDNFQPYHTFTKKGIYQKDRSYMILLWFDIRSYSSKNRFELEMWLFKTGTVTDLSFFILFFSPHSGNIMKRLVVPSDFCTLPTSQIHSSFKVQMTDSFLCRTETLMYDTSHLCLLTFLITRSFSGAVHPENQTSSRPSYTFSTVLIPDLIFEFWPTIL